jgi:hypothetical protein
MESGALRTKAGRRFKHSSIDTARSSLKALRQQFGPRSLRSISRVEAEDWAATVPPSKLPVVIAFINHLVRAEHIDRNRFAGLSRRSEGRANERPPNRGRDAVAVRGVLGARRLRADHARDVHFAAYTLMRPGELMALDWRAEV